MPYFLENFLFFSQKNPLIFTSVVFWIFFGIVLVGYSLIYKTKNYTLRSFYLFIFSIYFYYKTSGFFFVLLLFTTGSDYLLGNRIYACKEEVSRKILLSISVIINLAFLIYFKYAYFFTESYNQLFQSNYQVFNYFAHFSNQITGSQLDTSRIILPIGISFYTFQSLSYTIDIFRKKLEPVKNVLDYGFFVSFFPQLLSGPIGRASQFIPQIYKQYELNKADFGFALFLILQGLTKKIFIGDYIAVNFINRIFANPLHYTGFENLLALFGYSLQVYVDFSGYTDIATGVALLLGFRLVKNFNSPYKAQNVGDFWKRWHISLSSWLKDYLYIPLGGNRGGSLFSYLSLVFFAAILVILTKIWWLSLVFLALGISIYILAKIFPAFKRAFNTNINLMLTMLIGGFWHGSSLNFIVWGGLNGIGLVVYKFWRKISPWENLNYKIISIWKIFLTFTFITFTRVFFRADTFENAGFVLSKIFSKTKTDYILQIVVSYKWVFMVMLLGFILHWLPTRWKEWYKQSFINLPYWLQAIFSILLIILIYQSVSAESVPFIYFQF